MRTAWALPERGKANWAAKKVSLAGVAEGSSL
jgi:hypothetical protein